MATTMGMLLAYFKSLGLTTWSMLRSKKRAAKWLVVYLTVGVRFEHHPTSVDQFGPLLVQPGLQDVG